MREDEPAPGDERPEEEKPSSDLDRGAERATIGNRIAIGALFVAVVAVAVAIWSVLA